MKLSNLIRWSLVLQSRNLWTQGWAPSALQSHYYGSNSNADLGRSLSCGERGFESHCQRMQSQITRLQAHPTSGGNDTGTGDISGSDSDNAADPPKPPPRRSFKRDSSTITNDSSDNSVNSNNSRSSNKKVQPQRQQRKHKQDIPLISPLSLTMKELGIVLGGDGRAKSCWDCLRLGVDPPWYYDADADAVDPDEKERIKLSDGVSSDDAQFSGWIKENGWTRSQLETIMPPRRKDQLLGKKARNIYREAFRQPVESVVSLSKVTVCADGTTKLLLRLRKDGLEVEAVIIPWDDRKKSTLCVSTQIGCAQACTFCMTGRMGKLRNLDSSEILAQLYWSNKICRIADIYPVDNVVYMGMGESGDNILAVVRSANQMADADLFQLAPRRITISTVAPNPESFAKLGEANALLAWSIHASRDYIRKEMVPTTQHSMVELRQGLIDALHMPSRSRSLRKSMLEIALLDGINDSEEDARHLVEFCKPLSSQVKGLKLVVNLIPWNDIGVTSGPAANYKKPTKDRVEAFQKILVENGILCYTRTTRGDTEQAACGMLATSSKQNKGKRGVVATVAKN